MAGIKITLDVSKFDKSKIKERTFKTRLGATKTVKEYEIEVFEKKQPSLLAQGEKNGRKWRKIKTHFAVEAQTKEEREARKESNYVGDGYTFEYDDEPKADEVQDDGTGEINPDDIPF